MHVGQSAGRSRLKPQLSSPTEAAQIMLNHPNNNVWLVQSVINQGRHQALVSRVLLVVDHAGTKSQHAST